MNLLLSGPPGSGKSRAAMERFRAIEGSRLVVPTSTMAEHVRHEVARSGFPLRPSRITTLARVLDETAVSGGAAQYLIHRLIAESLERRQPARFAAVREFAGLHSAIAAAIEEAPEALPKDLQPVLADVESALRARGLALRNARLREAAAEGGTHLIFDGFFTFSPAELDFIEALSRRAGVTVTLPESPGSDAVRERLERAGFEAQRLTERRRGPRRVTFSASSAEHEASEIARRILERASRGGLFRDIGIVVRSRDPYAPVIETALARFGIPFRSYFTDPLAAHPAIAYLAGIVNCALGGWNHAGLAALVRMPVSGSGATADGDRLDFELRKQLPGAGFPLPQLPPSLSAAVAELETWMRERADAAVWAQRFKALTRFATAGPVEDAAGQEQVYAWRSTAAALRRFAELAEESAQFSSGRLSLAQFWKPLEAALAIEPLRVDDRRRNVVHVMDVFEARQWELPCVFVCGLLERDFPRYHSEDPIAGDAARRRAGLRTSADLQLEERFLFEMAVSRASEEVVLSYARFDEKGNETLPSFFLHDAPFAMCDARIRPAASRALPSRASSSIQDENLLEKLARSHRRLSASGVENFLQCPFQFFAGKTLRLRERPLEPRDRLDARAKGNILHKALAEWVRAPLLGAELLNRTFEDECARLHIPSGYRTEAVRLELLRHFENFLADDAYALTWPSRAEEEFQFALNSSITIRGRIDRMDISGDRAVVIDYKYSPGGRIRDHVDNTESGEAVQGGLYLMAVERAFQLQPAGMLFCGLKKDVSWGGWHVSIPGLQRVGEARRQEDIRELMEQAGQKVEETYALISQGRIAARPADTDKCRWCDFRDICRIESAAAAAEAGAR